MGNVVGNLHDQLQQLHHDQLQQLHHLMGRTGLSGQKRGAPEGEVNRRLPSDDPHPMFDIGRPTPWPDHHPRLRNLQRDGVAWITHRLRHLQRDGVARITHRLRHLQTDVR